MRSLISGVFAALLGALCLSSDAHAQGQAGALPPSLRSAGVTVAQWEQVRIAATRAAAAQGVSERALQSVLVAFAERLGLAQRPPDLNRLLAVVDERAISIRQLQERLDVLQRGDDPSTATFLRRAREAIEAGNLELADSILSEARLTARNARDKAQAREAEVVSVQAQTRLLRADYPGASQLYAEAAEIAPPSAIDLRWNYRLAQAGALQAQGELFAQPAVLRAAIRVYYQEVLPLAPIETRREAWADTQNALASAHLALGNLGDAADLWQGLRRLQEVARALSREAEPIRWADTHTNLAFALIQVGVRMDDASALRAAIPGLLDASRIFVDNRMLQQARRAALMSSLLVAILGARENDPALISRAADQAEQLIPTTDRVSDPSSWVLAHSVLCMVAQAMAERDLTTVWPGKAVAACAAAASNIDASREPFRRTQLEMLLGMSEFALGERSHDVAILRRAIARLRTVVSVTSPTQAPVPWAHAQLALAGAYTLLAEEQGDAALARAALEAAAAARRAVDEQSNPTLSSELDVAMIFALQLESKHTADLEVRRALLSRAFNLCIAALPRVRREDDGARWARLRYHYSGVLLQRGEIDGAPADVRNALAELEAAAAVAEQSGSAYYLERVARRRSEIQLALSRQTGARIPAEESRVRSPASNLRSAPILPPAASQSAETLAISPRPAAPSGCSLTQERRDDEDRVCTYTCATGRYLVTLSAARACPVHP